MEGGFGRLLLATTVGDTRVRTPHLTPDESLEVRRTHARCFEEISRETNFEEKRKEYEKDYEKLRSG